MVKQPRIFDADGNAIVSLRDWLATSASAADVERHRPMDVNPDDGGMEYLITYEDASYAFADAMLAARGAA